VIVKVAAWYYIANAALALLSSLVTLFGGLFGPALASMVFAGLFGAMGYGLLQREKWGRFLALGCSLLGWTLGGLILIALTGYLLIAVKPAGLLALLFAGGFMAALAWIFLITLLLWAVGVVISFKLFWHLCSPEGCEEFGVPPISAPTVVASTGAWLGLAFINIFATGGEQFMSEAAGVGITRDADQELREFEQQQGMREGEARRAAARAQAEAEAEAEADIQARLEAAQAEEAMSPEAAGTAEDVAEPAMAASPDAAAPGAPEANEQQPPMIEESEAPALPAAAATPAEEESETPAARKIVKCRDKSGGITFTQGYCPPGSQRVDMTPAE
jgi:hypothetical protein